MGMKRVHRNSFLTGVMVCVFAVCFYAVPRQAEAVTPLISFGGRVVSMFGLCLLPDGIVGIPYTVLLARVPPVPMKFMWSLTTISKPVPAVPPVVGHYIMGLAIPEPMTCVDIVPPFISVVGLKMVYEGTSVLPIPVP